MGAGNWVEFSFDPPDEHTGTIEYTILLRASNTDFAAGRLQVEVDGGGAGPLDQEVLVAPTGFDHEYVVVKAGQRVGLSSGTSHTLRVTFVDPYLSLDSVVIKSRGVPLP